MNLYAYCGNDPINYADPSGHVAISTLVLCGLALVGMGLTIGDVASDNNLMTAIGLTMVAIPALISGGMALACVGAWGTMVIGGVTIVAGVGNYATAAKGWGTVIKNGKTIGPVQNMRRHFFKHAIIEKRYTLGTNIYAYSNNARFLNSTINV